MLSMFRPDHATDGHKDPGLSLLLLTLLSLTLPNLLLDFWQYLHIRRSLPRWLQ